MGSWKKQVYLSADRLGLNAKTGLNATATSSTIDVEGFSQLTLCVLVTQSSATTSDFYIEVTDDGTNWFRLQSVSVAAGTATLSNLAYTKAITGSVKYAVNLPINYKKMRLVFSGTGAHATNDKVTVIGRLQE